MSQGATARRPYERERTEFLNLHEIVEAALQVTKEVGFQGLSMRPLGERLHVSHMALYHHVAGKRALQELVADAVLGRVELPGPETLDWVERLVVHARSFWNELAQFPGLADFVVNEHHVSDSARHLYEYTIKVLLDAGFPPRDAALGREALFALSPYYLTHPSAAARSQRGGHGRPSLSRWDPDVVAALRAAAVVGDLERWKFAKRTLLEGLRAQLQARRARTPRARGKA